MLRLCLYSMTFPLGIRATGVRECLQARKSLKRPQILKIFFLNENEYGQKSNAKEEQKEKQS